MASLDPVHIERLGRDLIALASALREDRGTPNHLDSSPSPRPRPRPPSGPPPDWLVSLAEGHTDGPVPLKGSIKQVKWAENLRRQRLTSLRHRGDMATVAVLEIIRDSGWWIGHAGMATSQVKWPNRHQVERPTSVEA